MRISYTKIVPLFAVTLGLAGCVSSQIETSIRDSVDSKRGSADLIMRKATSGITKAEKERSQEVNMPYISGRAVPVERSVLLPRALQKGVNTAILFPKNRISLTTAAERIMLATNLVVSIAPDVFIEDSMLLPKSVSAGSPKSAAPVVLNPSNAPMGEAPPLPALNAVKIGKENFFSTNEKDNDTPYSFDFPRTEAPLSQILDVICVRLGIKWKFEESTGTVRFFRLVTKTWSTPFAAESSRFTTDFEGSNGQTNNSNAVALKPGLSPVGSSSKDVNDLASLTKSIEAVMTRSGQVISNPSSGTITMTDTADAVEKADILVQNEINILSRVVQFKIETIQVSYANSEQTALDISGVISAALAKLPNLSFTTNAPATLTSTTAGSLNLSVLSGQGNGSAAVVRALSQIGQIQSSTTIPVLVRNHKAVYHNVTSTFSYVSATTPGTASISGGGTPGLTTSQDQVGLKLVLRPNITNKDTVMLTMALDQSELLQLDSFSSGSGNNVQTVQLPRKSAEGSTSEVAIKNGQTIVLTGFDKLVDQIDKRSLGKNVPSILGGSAVGKRDRVTTIVLVSVLIKDMDSPVGAL